MSETQGALLTPVAVMQLGRKKTLHRERLTIEGNRVILRTRCGLDIGDEGFTGLFAIPTCDDCEVAR